MSDFDGCRGGDDPGWLEREVGALPRRVSSYRSCKWCKQAVESRDALNHLAYDCPGYACLECKDTGRIATPELDAPHTTCACTCPT